MADQVDTSFQGVTPEHFRSYTTRLSDLLAKQDWSGAIALGEELLGCWKTGRQVFLVGNGGAGCNAVHLANDLLYPVSKRLGSGLRVQALLTNAAVLTCIANDEGYDQVFAFQLATQGRAGDVLVAMSASGNSPNILRALEQAREIGMRTFALVGCDGGRAKALADVVVHFESHDVQLVEDAQMAAGHCLMQFLYSERNNLGE